VVLVEYQSRWAQDFEALAAELRKLELAARGAIEHIGSTSVPGLVAKDVIDAQVRVPRLNVDSIATRFSDAGFRRRPEEWNSFESTRSGVIAKLVFAPPAGARPVNVHVRTDCTQGANYALLFRDYLRSEMESRIWWGDVKRSIVENTGTIDLASYGQAKQAMWGQLMSEADSWAAERDWRPTPLITWSLI
jgi:GrpB-like predicted nucleotidyltransferase (UPF0157 family)